MVVNTLAIRRAGGRSVPYIWINAVLLSVGVISLICRIVGTIVIRLRLYRTFKKFLKAKQNGLVITKDIIFSDIDHKNPVENSSTSTTSSSC